MDNWINGPDEGSDRALRGGCISVIFLKIAEIIAIIAIIEILEVCSLKLLKPPYTGLSEKSRG